MNAADLAEEIMELVGGKGNVLEAGNCMTRVRIRVLNMEQVNIPALMNLEDVTGVVKDNPIQIVLGPGKAQKVGLEFLDSMKEGYVKPIPLSLDKSWEDNKAAHATHHRSNAVKEIMAKISGIFTPIIPAVIAAGLCSGIGGLLGQNPLAAEGFLLVLSQFLSLIGHTFFTGFTVFTGIYAAKAFGASPALGGLLGAFPLNPMLSSIPGNGGGILGVIFGVWLLAKIEQALRKWVPDVITLLITPVISIVLAGSIYMYLIMPVTGWFTEILIMCIRWFTDSPFLLVRIITGFFLGAAFLPMVMGGYHHVFVILYALELRQVGDISLLPCLIMAGAGQVGASIAICLKAKMTGNDKMRKMILKALPGALLGIGEPLIYGVTLPMRMPFLTAGLGAGFGGALCCMAGVRMCAWGISGIAAAPLMERPVMMIWFLGALLLSYTMAFLITTVLVPKGAIEHA